MALFGRLEMRKAISLFLVFSIFLLSENMFAGERKGADLIIQKINGQQVRGELIAVKQNSLILLDRNSGADINITIEEIEAIRIIKKSKLLAGAGLGLVIGGGISALSFFAGGDVWNSDGSLFASAEEMAAFGAILGGFMGVIVGVIVSAIKGKDKAIQFIGKSDSEINEILEKLRKKAKIKHA
jgi:hypothetical protein